jgi:hypothetical protein
MIRGGTESAARLRLDVAAAAETEFDPESATNPIQLKMSAAQKMVRRIWFNSYMPFPVMARESPSLWLRWVASH